jgi:hypothetical protein
MTQKRIGTKVCERIRSGVLKLELVGIPRLRKSWRRVDDFAAPGVATRRRR